MPQDLILSVDAGTQSIRAAYIDKSGEIIGMHQTQIEPYYSAQPGWAEQDPEYFWTALKESIAGLVLEQPENAQRIAGVTLAVQRLTMINVDAEGKPLRPAIVWLDGRRADSKKVLGTGLRAVTKLIGIGGLVEFSTGYSRSNWIRQNEPEIWAKTHKYLFLSGWFAYKLTGRFVDSTANILGTIPFDLKKNEWSKPGSINDRLFPVEPEKLPEIVEPGAKIGELSEAVAAELGLPVGTPLFAGASDKACDVLGAGCLASDQASINFGTTATFNVPIDDYLEIERFLPPFPSALPNKFHTEVAVLRGLWLVSWFKQEFGLAERLAAEETGRAPEELLDALVRDIPPGSMGLITTPTWMSGPHGDPFGKGAVFGFGDVHTRAHLYRSILEGIVFALREGADRTVRKTKVPLTVVRASGGGSSSDVLMQITADVFGIPAQRPHTQQTSVVGAAITAAIGLGWYANAEEAVNAMTRQGDTFEPNATAHELYEDLFQRVYVPSHARLAPLYEQIAKATGYPAV